LSQTPAPPPLPLELADACAPEVAEACCELASELDSEVDCVFPEPPAPPAPPAPEPTLDPEPLPVKPVPVVSGGVQVPVDVELASSFPSKLPVAVAQAMGSAAVAPRSAKRSKADGLFRVDRGCITVSVEKWLK
jgi:hypothetical protein